jgi:histone H3/H4
MLPFLLLCDIYKKIMYYMKMINESRIDQIISEEISKADVDRAVTSKLASSYDSREFKKAVKEIVADAIEDLYRTLFNRSSSWRGGVVR